MSKPQNLRNFIPAAAAGAVSGATVCWMRRDLRLRDNAALYHALKESSDVVVLFIFDTVILDALEDEDDKRVHFIHQSLAALQSSLTAAQSSLIVLYGDPVAIFRQLNPRAVYANHDYESYAKRRDAGVAKLLESRNIPFRTFKDHVIFEKTEVAKSDATPYTVFTPYSRRWRETLTPFYAAAYPVEPYLGSLKRLGALPLLPLEAMGFRPSGAAFPARLVKTAVIRNYDTRRNFPAVEGTSRLGVHLRFGTISIRELVRLALRENDTWLNELIWRDFFAMILSNFPHVEKGAFKPAYDDIEWSNDEAGFARWCEGRTGYPIVDAGMRELNETGFMHNRVRMITASFLTKHLLIDWRWGEAWFARKLLDFDLASNNGGWQWAAGSGCDAAPYFRVFNPALQTERFDPDHAYIRRWVPEFGTPAYPPPVVEHRFARDRAIRVYKAALDRK